VKPDDSQKKILSTGIINKQDKISVVPTFEILTFF
jgi:hypothetical protein